MQATADKRRPGKAVVYKQTVRVRTAKAPRWVRVIDRAGNPSKWRRLVKRWAWSVVNVRVVKLLPRRCGPLQVRHALDGRALQWQFVCRSP